MQFGFTIVYVPDVSASLAFWEQAFGLTRRFLAKGGDYGELDTGATTLAFAAESLAAGHGLAIRPHRAADDPAAFEIALVADDVQAAYDRAVAAGATPAHVPEQKPWRQVAGYVRDANGVLVELCTPVAG